MLVYQRVYPLIYIIISHWIAIKSHYVPPCIGSWNSHWVPDPMIRVSSLSARGNLGPKSQTRPKHTYMDVFYVYIYMHVYIYVFIYMCLYIYMFIYNI
jgi:hypothetical protein